MKRGRHTPVTADEKLAILKARLEGLKYQTIAMDLNRSVATVAKVAKELGVTQKGLWLKRYDKGE
jgi:lambda repressor-like predicted transcriptional regulator